MMETINFEKQAKAIELAIDANLKFKAELCFALGEYNPFEHIRCRNCRISNMCIAEKINRKYRKGINK